MAIADVGYISKQELIDAKQDISDEDMRKVLLL